MGWFSQPSVARMLIEQNETAEMVMIFLAISQPSFSRFQSLEAIDKEFTNTISTSLNQKTVA